MKSHLNNKRLCVMAIVVALILVLGVMAHKRYHNGMYYFDQLVSGNAITHIYKVSVSKYGNVVDIDTPEEMRDLELDISKSIPYPGNSHGIYASFELTIKWDDGTSLGDMLIAVGDGNSMCIGRPVYGSESFYRFYVIRPTGHTLVWFSKLFIDTHGRHALTLEGKKRR